MRQALRSTTLNTARSQVSVVLLLGLFLITGCRTEMYDQPRYDTFEASTFFSDGIASRPLVSHTVARGWEQDDDHLYLGRENGELVTTFPFEINASILNQGRTRFETFCSPCHGVLGDGNGMVVLRGMPKPPSLHDQRLQEVPVGHFFDVITRGYGAMYSYAHRIKPQDRWAVVAYIKALQLSQNTPVNTLSPDDQLQLDRAQEVVQ